MATSSTAFWQGVVIYPRGCDGGWGRTGRKKLHHAVFYVLTKGAYVRRITHKEFLVEVQEGSITATLKIDKQQHLSTFPKGTKIKLQHGNWKFENATTQEVAFTIEEIERYKTRRKP